MDELTGMQTSISNTTRQLTCYHYYQNEYRQQIKQQNADDTQIMNCC